MMFGAEAGVANVANRMERQKRIINTYYFFMHNFQLKLRTIFVLKPDRKWCESAEF